MFFEENTIVNCGRFEIKYLPELHLFPEGALAGVQRCTASPYFKMDCNAPPNFGDLIKNVLEMGVQNQVLNTAMHPCFQIPNALSDEENFFLRLGKIF